jgi:hypothetical protein
LSVYSKVLDDIDKLTEGPDGEQWVVEKVLSSLSDEERDVFDREFDIAESLHFELGANTRDPRIEAAFVEAGLEVEQR